MLYPFSPGPFASLVAGNDASGGAHLYALTQKGEARRVSQGTSTHMATGPFASLAAGNNKLYGVVVQSSGHFSPINKAYIIGSGSNEQVGAALANIKSIVAGSGRVYCITGPVTSGTYAAGQVFDITSKMMQDLGGRRGFGDPNNVAHSLAIGNSEKNHLYCLTTNGSVWLLGGVSPQEISKGPYVQIVAANDNTVYGVTNSGGVFKIVSGSTNKDTQLGCNSSGGCSLSFPFKSLTVGGGKLYAMSLAPVSQGKDLHAVYKICLPGSGCSRWVQLGTDTKGSPYFQSLTACK